MNDVIPDRMTAELEGEFVVFLIGMRINKLWKPHRWIPPARAMARMQRELAALSSEETGLLATKLITPGMTVQYWRSFDHLEAYANSADRAHRPAWQAFNDLVKSSRGDVGIWHETFLVKAGEHESLYSGMPPQGLGLAGTLVPATGHKTRARSRLKQSLQED